MKILRLAIVLTIVSLLVVLTLSLTVMGDSESGNTITPVNDVYEVYNKDQLIWLFGALGDGSVPASSYVKLMNDIDVAGGLPTLSVAFTGTFDGNGKTISGLSRTIFKQFNGTVSNLTLRGTMNNPYSDNDSARKVASLALNSSNSTLINVVSYVNITTSASDTNAGAIVGYCNATYFSGCAYYGTYNLQWKGSGAGLGGMVGWLNPYGGTAVFENCHFGGTIKLTGSSTGKAYVGGIVGNCNNTSLTIKNCSSNGTLISQATSGGDYVGGILGIGARTENIITSCTNKSSITAVTSAGGIIGGITVNSSIASCANFGTITANQAGEFCGKSDNTAAVLTITDSVEFSEDELAMAMATTSIVNCYTANEVSLVGSFTLDGVVYERYNVCVVEKDRGLLMPTLSTNKMFEAYLSMRDDGNTESIRFVIVTNNTCTADSITVDIAFRNDVNKVIKTYSGTLAQNDGDLKLYTSVTAAGQKYFAATGNAIFGCVVNNIPKGAWASLEMTVKDTETNEKYMAPCGYEIAEIMTLESLPDYASLGTVSGVYNCGPGLMSDRNSITEEDSYMVVISSTTADKLAGYVATLPDYGYRLISQNTLDGDTYYTFSKAGAILYLYHSSKVKETRIIVDNSSTPLAKINYDYTKEEGDTTEFYQYSINYTSVDQEGYDPVTYTETSGLDCGMAYIIKLPDNKIIMIDGGHRAQMSATAKASLIKFLRQITGKKDNEKVDIAMWYFTHAHGDHVAAAADIIADYRNQINLESVTFNFPSYQVLSDNYDDNTFTLKQNINNYFPNVKYHKLHTGEVLSLAGVTFEIVYTHEDAVAAASSSWGGTKPGGTTEISSFNDSSTVSKITIDGQTIMLLGDVDSQAQTVINAFHNSSYLKSDMVQAAHHAYNNVRTLYGYILADIGLFPNSMYSAKEASKNIFYGNSYSQIMKNATQEYFAHKYTYKFVVENGKFVATALPRYDQQ